MKSILLLFFAVLFSGFTWESNRTKKVVFFGDSIVYEGSYPDGFINQIKEISKKKRRGNSFEFINAGRKGDKVTDLYLRLERDVLVQKPDIVVIMIGINDVWHKSTIGTGTDFVPFTEFYERIVNKLKENGVKVICCTPTVIGEKLNNQNTNDEELNIYANQIKTICYTSNSILVDLRFFFFQFLNTYNPTSFEKGILTLDQIHLNKQGNQIVAESVYQYL